jgi:excisionase family DNA binding protein
VAGLIEAHGSGVVGGHAVIGGLAAVVIVRVLGDWRRAIPPGAPVGTVAAVEEAVDALRASAARWTSAQTARPGLPRPGTGEGTRQPNHGSSRPWLTTTEAAAEIGVSPRRVRQLADERVIRARKVDGRLRFDPEDVLRRATARA